MLASIGSISYIGCRSVYHVCKPNIYVATLRCVYTGTHNANDAKTFLKHFSDCLFCFCSTCADSITYFACRYGTDRQTDRLMRMRVCVDGMEGVRNNAHESSVYVTSLQCNYSVWRAPGYSNWQQRLIGTRRYRLRGRKHDRRGATERRRTTLDCDTTINWRTDN